MVIEYKLIPDESKASPFGLYNVALVAGPLLPVKLVLPVPAYVVIIPVDAVILRMRWLPMSLKYTFPLESIAIPCGLLIVALDARPVSPV